MMKLRGNKAILMLLCVLCFYQMKAQSFRYQTLTHKVPQTGFYSIPVTPELSAHMQVDFSDVRVLDDKGKQVPYIVRGHRQKWQNSLFKPFPIVSSKLDDSANSVIVFQKSISQNLNQFWIIQKNAAVIRQASLSGSNDQKNWFIIEQNILLNETYETSADSNFQAVQFTPSNYTFFRLVIDNEKKEPLNIQAIGYYTNGNYSPQLLATQNPAPAFVQTDSSDGYSYLKVTQQQPYPINSIGFKNIGQKYFTRTVRLVVAPTLQHTRKKPLAEWASFVLSADALEMKGIPVFKSNEFWLIVYNGDNPPVQPNSITTSQGYHEVVAYLQAGKQYKLMMDADNASVPNYDLQQFQDSIPAIVSNLNIGSITAVNAANDTAEKAGFPRKYIWLIMAGIVALLSLLTWRLTTEMRKSA